MLSDNIRNYRKENNMSQDELAEKLDVSRQSVSLWENGQTQPTIENIIALAKIFNISTDVLLGNTEEAKASSDTDATDLTGTDREIENSLTTNTAEKESAITDSNGKIESEALIKSEKNAILGKKSLIGIALGIIIFIVVIASVGISVGRCSRKTDTTPSDDAPSVTIEKESNTELESVTSVVTEKITDVTTSKNVETTAAPKKETTVVPVTQAPEPATEAPAPVTEAPVPVTEAPEPITEAPKKQEETTAKPKAVTTAKKAETEAPEEEPFDLFEYCKEFAIEKGTLNGDYSMYQKPSSIYGGYDGEYFSISYWSDSNMVEFCLHCPLDDTLSINFYLRMRGGFDGTYEYCTSKYYRDTGDSVRTAIGTIFPSVFSDQYPLSCDEYYGSTSGKSDFMEESRVGMVDLIKCLKSFVKVEKLKCDFEVFGFKKF